MLKESFEIFCADGAKLKGILLIPEDPKAVVQFNSATGTKREVYLSFLTYLVEHKYLCCLWDYRGSGHSSPDDMKNCYYTFSDYGLKDMPTIKSFLNNRFPNLPFVMIGHSVGGQQIGFMNNLNGVRGVINFAVASGYFANMSFGYRMKAYFYFYILAPISILLFGYAKTKVLAIMEDLPRKVFYEWRDWLTKEDYLFDKKYYSKTIPSGSFRNLKFPIHAYWSSDDPVSNEKNIKAFWRNVESEGEITFSKITPLEFGIKHIGHFGFFRRAMRHNLWKDVVGRLDKLVAD